VAGATLITPPGRMIYTAYGKAQRWEPDSKKQVLYT
jgi:hypothetical protein